MKIDHSKSKESELQKGGGLGGLWLIFVLSNFSDTLCQMYVFNVCWNLRKFKSQTLNYGSLLWT